MPCVPRVAGQSRTNVRDARRGVRTGLGHGPITDSESRHPCCRITPDLVVRAWLLLRATSRRATARHRAGACGRVQKRRGVCSTADFEQARKGRCVGIGAARLTRRPRLRLPSSGRSGCLPPTSSRRSLVASRATQLGHAAGLPCGNERPDSTPPDEGRAEDVAWRSSGGQPGGRSCSNAQFMTIWLTTPRPFRAGDHRRQRRCARPVGVRSALSRRSKRQLRVFTVSTLCCDQRGRTPRTADASASRLRAGLRPHPRCAPSFWVAGCWWLNPARRGDARVKAGCYLTAGAGFRCWASWRSVSTSRS
jgi:hypothetical protein